MSTPPGSLRRHDGVGGPTRLRRIWARARVMTPRVVLYGRAGCCLCDDARKVLERVAATQPFALVERDIDTDEELLRAYLERIPVVTIEGMEAFEFSVDEAELRERLSRVAGR